MTHRLLAAAALMLVTTSISWANTEGVPNVKTPDPEKVATQMEDTLEEIQAFTVEQKNEAMRAARHALDDLDRQITLLQSEIDTYPVIGDDIDGKRVMNTWQDPASVAWTVQLRDA